MWLMWREISSDTWTLSQNDKLHRTGFGLGSGNKDGSLVWLDSTG
jgi:hypothetical protein